MREYLDMQDIAHLWGMDKEKLKKRIQNCRRRPEKERRFPEPDIRAASGIPFWNVERRKELTDWARLNGWIE